MHELMRSQYHQMSLKELAMDQKNGIIKILEVDGEEGSISLLGRFSQGQWDYTVSHQEKFSQRVAAKKSPKPSQSDVKWMPWGQAITDLDRHSWVIHAPRQLHVEFRQQVLALVQERLYQKKGCDTSKKWMRLARWLDLTDV
jgi:hypothetical protein